MLKCKLKTGTGWEIQLLVVIDSFEIRLEAIDYNVIDDASDIRNSKTDYDLNEYLADMSGIKT